VRMGNGSCKTTIGSINVEPQAVLLAKRADFRQRIDRNCAPAGDTSTNSDAPSPTCLTRTAQLCYSRRTS